MKLVQHQADDVVRSTLLLLSKMLEALSADGAGSVEHKMAINRILVLESTVAF